MATQSIIIGAADFFCRSRYESPPPKLQQFLLVKSIKTARLLMITLICWKSKMYRNLPRLARSSAMFTAPPPPPHHTKSSSESLSGNIITPKQLPKYVRYLRTRLTDNTLTSADIFGKSITGRISDVLSNTREFHESTFGQGVFRKLSIDW